MTEATPPSLPGKTKIGNARDVLAAFGLDKQQHGDASALTLLALANLSPGQAWSEASAPLMRVVEIMAWIKAEYGVNYAPNTRETIRRHSLGGFLKAGLITTNPDDPSRSPVSSRWCYQLREGALNILRGYGNAAFAGEASSYALSIVDSLESGRELAGADNLDVVLRGLVDSPIGLRAAEAAVIEGRRRVLVELRALLARPDTTETAMQKILQNNHWIFGGQYVAISPRRGLVPMQQHDILLVTADKSLTIVELKGPCDALLARPRERHLTVSASVNDAVGQSMNYLRSMDEFSLSLGTTASDDLGLDYDFRRADALVVIGNQDRPGKPDANRAQVDQVLRMYNSHLSRIRVLTYTDLLDVAERALQFDT